jgi:hypothetical protein
MELVYIRWKDWANIVVAGNKILRILKSNGMATRIVV